MHQMVITTMITNTKGFRNFHRSLLIQDLCSPPEINECNVNEQLILIRYSRFFLFWDSSI